MVWARGKACNDRRRFACCGRGSWERPWECFQGPAAVSLLQAAHFKLSIHGVPLHVDNRPLGLPVRPCPRPPMERSMASNIVRCCVCCAACRCACCAAARCAVWLAPRASSMRASGGEPEWQRLGQHDCPVRQPTKKRPRSQALSQWRAHESLQPLSPLSRSSRRRRGGPMGTHVGRGACQGRTARHGTIQRPPPHRRPEAREILPPVPSNAAAGGLPVHRHCAAVGLGSHIPQPLPDGEPGVQRLGGPPRPRQPTLHALRDTSACVLKRSRSSCSSISPRTWLAVLAAAAHKSSPRAGAGTARRGRGRRHPNAVEVRQVLARS